MCCDRGRQWELVIGEFSGKPFNPDNDKIFTDRCKLFRCMKGVLDDRLRAISQNGIERSAYEIAKNMLVYSVQSYGNTMEIFAMNMPFPKICIVCSICSLDGERGTG